jgi:type I restriction enzyme S subunit
LSVFLDDGVVPRASRDDNFNRLGDDLSKYLVVKAGDIVFNKLRTWQGGIGVSAYAGIVSPAYFVCEPSAAAVPRYLHYLLRSRPYLAELTRISKWMPPSQFDIGWDELRLLPTLLPPINEQRVIGTYLDEETARIDALVEAKRRMTELLDERMVTTRERWCDALEKTWGRVPLGRLVDRIEQGWSPDCASAPADPEEWGVLKTSAVTGDVFRPEENKRLLDATSFDRRWIVREGDLLVTRGSGSRSHVGRAVVAKTDGRNLLLPDLIYRLVTTRAETGFVADVLGSRSSRDRIQAAIRTDAGQTLKLRGDDLRDLPIPAVETAFQAEEHERLKATLAPHLNLTEVLNRQIILLIERRQTLITAAVTGEIDISGVAVA